MKSRFKINQPFGAGLTPRTWAQPDVQPVLLSALTPEHLHQIQSERRVIDMSCRFMRCGGTELSERVNRLVLEVAPS